jgi:AcrR family transcriptional regulator
MNEPPRKPDRRIERTKHLLFEALVVLTIERGYESITLQDIAERANVARTTFYLHYKDKDELLFDGVRSMIDELIAKLHNDGKLLSNVTSHTSLMDDASDFEHVAKYADFYRVMLGRQGSAAFLASIRDYLAMIMQRDILSTLKTLGHDSALPSDLIAYYLAGAELGVIAWWLNQNDLTLSAPQMARMMYHLCLYGLNWALGTAEPLPPMDAALLPADQTASLSAPTNGQGRPSIG